jgi:hypothetical protein
MTERWYEKAIIYWAWQVGLDQPTRTPTAADPPQPDLRDALTPIRWPGCAH